MATDDSLAAAIDAAEITATPLDDCEVVDNDAVYAWMRAHELHKGKFGHLVIGKDILPLAWRDQTLKFSNQSEALSFASKFKADSQAMQTLRRLVPSAEPGETVDAFLTRLAGSLLTGSIWAIRPQRIPNALVGKTDPKVFDAINPALGTSIDFREIAKLEGGQWLRGYVPFTKAGKVIESSGMTIATGFDIGQWSEAQVLKMKFPQELTDKLTPFCALPFKGMTKAEVVKLVAKTAPVPQITKAEADLCDGVVFTAILKAAMNKWNSAKDAGVPTFTAMPGAWQTVWLSRNYQEGAKPKTEKAQDFRESALAGDWQDAIDVLKDYGHFQSRATSEATSLSTNMPPAMPKPK